MNGILIVDKPEGVTSAEVVRRVKRRVRVKVGHLGTLDPFATGVLPLCLGEATKIAQFLNVADKQYEGLIALGTATDTGDRTGRTTLRAPLPALDENRLDDVARRFVGEYSQVPPMYSALKRAGVPLYRLARQGIEVERTGRRVRIISLQLTMAGCEQLYFQVTCSKGTYVRVLAEDIGVALGTAAHLTTLRRTHFGLFDLTQAVDLAAWTPGDAGLVPIRRALSHLPRFDLDWEGARAVRQGQGWVLTSLGSGRGCEMATLVDPEDEVVAVVVNQGGGRWSFGRVFQERHSLQESAPVLSNGAK